MNNILIVIFYVLFSFLLAYVSSLLAKSRNQSRALWFWLTLIFPIAIVFIAFKDKQALNQKILKIIIFSQRMNLMCLFLYGLLQ